MKELYSIKSGAYKTSKDYARLKELLDAEHYVICFIHYAPQRHSIRISRYLHRKQKKRWL